MSNDELLRADVALCARGLAASRERAQALIAAGMVRVNGSTVKKPAQRISAAEVLEVLGDCCPYVSRGGFKLERALRCFQVNPAGMVALDVGASTGGFTDVLLQSGARLVYAVDVGTAQLDPKIEADPRVVKMERTNARTLERSMFPIPPELAVMDVSFISIRKILPALRAVLGERGRLISLIKPQFEAGREALGKRGVIGNPLVHERVLREIAALAPELGWQVQAYEPSPIAGTQGNLEFLADFVPSAQPIPTFNPQEIRALVRRAHMEIKP